MNFESTGSMSQPPMHEGLGKATIEVAKTG